MYAAPERPARRFVRIPRAEIAPAVRSDRVREIRYERPAPALVRRPNAAIEVRPPARRISVENGFVRRVRVAPQRVAPQPAAFVQYVRARRADERERVRVPHPIAVVPILYHPAYLTGRVVRVVRNSYIVLAPPVGRQVVVRCACNSVPVSRYVTVPATYSNGAYYASAYSPQYYRQVAQWYSNYYGVPVQYENGYYVPQYPGAQYPPYSGYGYSPYGSGSYSPYGSGSYYPYGSQYGNSSYWQYLPIAAALLGNVPYVGSLLDTLAQYSTYGAYGNGYGYNGYGYNGYGYNAPPYGNGNYGANPYYAGSYGTPYDQCLNSTDDDSDGDGTCAPVSTYGANGYGAPYGTYGAYGLPLGQQQVQGVVVGRSGSMLMVLGGNGLNPIVVDAAPALQNGYAMNGPIASGQVVDAFGYYNGNVFVATALV
ncbi:MAG TPA: hypothetical protein VFA29_12225 [Candidatus Baltobacteraceae bacterium]|nr:hypothetical protein [Candidatus Baltobacteraceae bacterium]